ncbi:MAG TPA: DMT family transporter [Caulobacteraceae bacterium]|nr:DMT family transporter [Caulobacteraceae bacterium]
MTTWIYAAWAFVAGALIPVMATLNGGLGRGLGSPQWATVVLMAVGLATALSFAALSGVGPNWTALRQAPFHQYLGGLMVAFYGVSATYLTPRFGVGPTVLFVVAAQIVISSLIGQFGWLGAPRQPIDVQRAIGLALMIVGVMLVQIRRT